MMVNRKVIKTPRGERSRQRILDATGRLIARYGGNHVTLDQVAEECNISKSSILWHFGSKDELRLEVVDTVCHRFAEAIISKYKAELSAIEKITHLLNDYNTVSIDRPEIPTIFFSNDSKRYSGSAFTGTVSGSPGRAGHGPVEKSHPFAAPHSCQCQMEPAFAQDDGLQQLGHIRPENQIRQTYPVKRPPSGGKPSALHHTATLGPGQADNLLPYSIRRQAARIFGI